MPFFFYEDSVVCAKSNSRAANAYAIEKGRRREEGCECNEELKEFAERLIERGRFSLYRL